MQTLSTSTEARIILSAVLIVLVALKATGEISLSWWWVLAPMWIPTLIVLVLFATFLSAGLIAGKR